MEEWWGGIFVADGGPGEMERLLGSRAADDMTVGIGGGEWTAKGGMCAGRVMTDGIVVRIARPIRAGSDLASV